MAYYLSTSSNKTNTKAEPKMPLTPLIAKGELTKLMLSVGQSISWIVLLLFNVDAESDKRIPITKIHNYYYKRWALVSSLFSLPQPSVVYHWVIFSQAKPAETSFVRSIATLFIPCFCIRDCGEHCHYADSPQIKFANYFEFIIIYGCPSNQSF